MRPGSHVSTVDLARELRLSRMPVREAVTQLASEGLLELVPRLGAIVKRANGIADVKDLFDMRQILEGAAAARAARRATPAQLNRIATACAEMEAVTNQVRARKLKDLDAKLAARRLAADLTFHDQLARASRSPRLVKMLTDLNLLSRLWWRMDPSLIDLHERLRWTDRSHRDVLDRIKARNVRGARRALLRHVRKAREWYLLTLDEEEQQA
jgi:DNA-binding GntR family transcriptional regulator